MTLKLKIFVFKLIKFLQNEGQYYLYYKSIIQYILYVYNENIKINTLSIFVYVKYCIRLFYL